MTSLLRILIVLPALLPWCVRATPAEAAQIKASYQSAVETWSREAAAAGPDARSAMAAKRPDPAVYARRMWTLIAPSITQEWVLDPLAWFVGITMNLPVPPQTGLDQPTRPFAKEHETAINAITTAHMKSGKLAPLCLTYASASDPASMKLLETIHSTHALKPMRGAAALALAIRLRALGEAPEVMSRRLSLLREAIIESSDLDIGGTPATKLIQDQLYVINHLTKGRPAPALEGTDSGGRPLNLADHKGKVVVLVFWNSGLPDVVRLLESLTALRKQHAEKKFTLLGINGDALAQLRAIQKTDADLLEFPNFSDPDGKLATTYRVTAQPVAFVLDAEQRIQFIGTPGGFMNATVDALLAPPDAKPAK